MKNRKHGRLEKIRFFEQKIKKVFRLSQEV